MDTLPTDESDGKKHSGSIRPLNVSGTLSTALPGMTEAKYISVITQDSDRLSQDTTSMDVMEDDLLDTKIKASPKDDVLLIESPKANDVLMPMEGYRMWNGNVFFLSLILAKRSAFLQTTKKMEQAVILIEMIQAVHNRRGRFLMAIQKPLSPENSSQVKLPPGLDENNLLSTTVWQVLNETDVLLQVTKLLRSKVLPEEEDADKRLRRKEVKRRRRERRALRKQRASATASKSTMHATAPGADEDQVPKQIPSSYMDILQGLYYVPSYYPLGSGHEDGDSDSHSSSDTSTSSDEDSNDADPKIAKKRRIGWKSTDQRVENQSSSKTSSGNDSKTAGALSKDNMTFHYKPKSIKSQQALIEEGLDPILPRGVTIRPSGKWQAQIYWAGQSRYVGVYDSSRLAARAYTVTQDFLRQYRTSGAFSRDTPKEALAAVFATARRIADDAVRALLNEDDELNSNTSDPLKDHLSNDLKRKAEKVAKASGVEFEPIIDASLVKNRSVISDDHKTAGAESL